MPFAFRYQLIRAVTREVLAEAPDFAAMVAAKRLLGHSGLWIEIVKP